MAIKTFEFCSLHYLNQWLTFDRKFCTAMSNGSDDDKLIAMKNAAGFYSVARNLPKYYDEVKGLKRYEPILRILNKVTMEQVIDDPVKTILKIENKISRKYGNRRVLSLTTKFLWLKFQHPVLIYDDQARNALGSKKGDLVCFYKYWRKEFETNKETIEDACLRLPKLYLYSVDQNMGTKRYINKLVSKLWFWERVFDIYLWNKGI